jgi:hypothetical protein
MDFIVQLYLIHAHHVVLVLVQMVIPLQNTLVTVAVKVAFTVVRRIPDVTNVVPTVIHKL